MDAAGSHRPWLRDGNFYPSEHGLLCFSALEDGRLWPTCVRKIPTSISTDTAVTIPALSNSALTDPLSFLSTSDDCASQTISTIMSSTTSTTTPDQFPLEPIHRINMPGDTEERPSESRSFSQRWKPSFQRDFWRGNANFHAVSIPYLAVCHPDRLWWVELFDNNDIANAFASYIIFCPVLLSSSSSPISVTAPPSIADNEYYGVVKSLLIAWNWMVRAAINYVAFLVLDWAYEKSLKRTRNCKDKIKNDKAELDGEKDSTEATKADQQGQSGKFDERHDPSDEPKDAARNLEVTIECSWDADEIVTTNMTTADTWEIVGEQDEDVDPHT